MIPTDETRRPKNSRLSPPSLADDTRMKWEIQEFNFEVETFRAGIEATKRRKESVVADGIPGQPRVIPRG